MSSLAANSLRRPFQMTRDDAGVPHIRADNLLDALYGLGYMHATDRATQLLFGRAVASGSAAGRITDKEELLETDQFFRRIGLHLNLSQTVEGLDEYTLRQLAIYSAGINDGIQASGPTLPMWAVGFEPQPWNPESAMLIGRLLAFGGLAISQMQNERLLIELTHAGANDAALAEMFEPRLDHVDFELIRRVHLSHQMSDEALELLIDLPRLAGSNAWAVAPERSSTGAALLAADPHLEVNRLPAIWYEAVLQWDDQYVMGATLPGCPLFAVARTNRLAWGVTYLKGDTVDYFVEDCRKNDDENWQYRRHERWHDFDVRRETIERRGDEPLELEILENDVGTLDSHPDEHGDGLYLSVAWTGRWADTGLAISPWLDLIAAESTTMAMDVVAECSQPTLCFVFADTEGHIGKQSCGTFPKRPQLTTGLGPLPAWDTANHWQGWLPKEVLPSEYDPPSGYVATANEEQNPPGGPLLVTQTVNDYRKRRISNRLEELPSATIKDMQQLQYDVVSVQAQDLLAELLPHVSAGKLKERLANWNCDYAPESEEATLFQRFYRNVMVELLGHDRGVGWMRMFYLCSRTGFSSMVLTAADRLLLRDTSWWWHGRDKAEIIRTAAEKTDADDHTPWSEVNHFHFANRFVGSPRVGRLFGYHSKRHPMPGCHATPFQGHVFLTARREATFAPSYHFVTDLGQDEAWTNLPGGASESRFSKFYRNDIPLWLAGDYKRLVVK